MKQVFFTGSEYKVVDVPAPACLPGGVLVQNHFSVISAGTETSGMRRRPKSKVQRLADNSSRPFVLANKTWNKIRTEGLDATMRAIRNRYPDLNALGYSCAGSIVQVGEGVKGLSIGERVACGGSGYANHAEVVWVPENLVARVPDNVGLKEAAYGTIGAIAMQGIRRAEKLFGEHILIAGLGLLGLIGLQIARAAGLRIVGYDPNRARGTLALSLGAEEVFSDSAELVHAVQRLTKGVGFDAAVIFAATRSSEPVDLAMRVSRVRGRVVVVGDVGLELKRESMYRKELDLVMSTSAGPGRYDPAYEERGQDYPAGYVRWTENRNMQEFLKLMADAKVDVNKLTDLTVDIEEAQKAYSRLLYGEKRPPGVVLKYRPKDGIPSRIQRISSTAPAAKSHGSIRIALLGAGGFAQSTHIPNIMANKDCELRAVLNTSGSKATMLASKYGAAYAITDIREMLTLPDIDAVVICTPHYLHSEQVIVCLKAGKHVLVEKPLALNGRQLRDVLAAAKSADRVIAVGFNRRYSPLISQMKDAIRSAGSPVVIQYRINAGFIPASHWTQQPEIGGGRIIGEVCHFIDACSYLIGTPIKEISAHAVAVNNSSIVAFDNVAVVLRYSDGSLANILYTSLGSQLLPKERMELYVNRNVAVLEDYRSLTWYGGNRKATDVKQPSKGFKEQLEEFVKAIRGLPHRSITLQEAAETTLATFKVQELIHGAI